jgi:hypothetical protein
VLAASPLVTVGRTLAGRRLTRLRHQTYMCSRGVFSRVGSALLVRTSIQ